MRFRNARRETYWMEVEAELKRRNEKKIERLEEELDAMRKRHKKEYDAFFSELVRYYRAKPGTKYDARKRKGRLR